MHHHTAKSLTLLLAAIIGCLLCACSNSEGVDSANHVEEIAAVNEVSSDSNIPKVQETSFSSKELDYLPLDDTEYPYAGIPRIVIETENHQKIKDRETEIPAKLQIWGAKAPESELMDLTIRGRGNTSWDMPKKGYKVEFKDKQSILGMPMNKDWALLANYSDKTLLKNYFSFHLYKALGARYSPQSEFVELFLNGEYIGIYQFTETIKINPQRLNLTGDTLFLIEVDDKYKESDLVIKTASGKTFSIKYPQKADSSYQQILKNHLDSIEMKSNNFESLDLSLIANWINLEDFASHYWVQEFAKNPDAGFHTSVYFTWRYGEPISMGPVWDFDVAYGGFDQEVVTQIERWYTNKHYWNKALFKNPVFVDYIRDYWNKNQHIFLNAIDSLDSYRDHLQQATKNNFKKWNILKSTEFCWHIKAYNNYAESVEDLKQWMYKRLQWIDTEINK